jgi:hypothetical protein
MRDRELLGVNWGGLGRVTRTYALQAYQRLLGGGIGTLAGAQALRPRDRLEARDARNGPIKSVPYAPQ